MQENHPPAASFRPAPFASVLNFLIIALLALLTGFSIWKIFHQATFVFNREKILHQFYLNNMTLALAFITLAALIAIFLKLETLTAGKLTAGKFTASMPSASALFLSSLPLIIVIAGQGTTLFALAVFCLANLGIGLSLKNLFRSHEEYDWFHLLFNGFLGLGLNAIIIWIAMHYKINYQYVYYLFFIAEIVLSYKALLGVYPIVVNKMKDATYSAAQKAIVIAAVFYVFYALVPAYLHDDLVRHLHVPNYVSIHGLWHFNPEFVMAIDPSILPQSAYTAVYVLGGEYAIRLLHYGLFFVGFLLIEGYVRKTFNRAVAFYTTLTLILTPFLLMEFGVVYTDSFYFFSAILFFIYFINIIHNLTLETLNYYFILCAFIMLTKLQGMFIIIPCSIILLVSIISQREFCAIAYALSGLFLFTLILTPILAHNYLVSGNPIFPWFNKVFQSPWFVSDMNFQGEWQKPLSWDSLYDITFYGASYIQNINYSLGVSYFIFLPFIFFIFKKQDNDSKKSRFIILFTFVTSFLLCSFITGTNMRYWIAILPFGAILVGLIIEAISERFERQAVLTRSFQAILVLVFLTNFICQLGVINTASPYPILTAFTKNYGKSHLTQSKLQRQVFEFASLKYGSKAKCLLIDTVALYFANCDATTNHWYHSNESMRLFKASSFFTVNQKAIDTLATDKRLDSFSKALNALKNKVFTDERQFLDAIEIQSRTQLTPELKQRILNETRLATTPTLTPAALFHIIFNVYRFDYIIMPETTTDELLNAKEFRALLTKQYANQELGLYSPKVN